MKTWMGHRRWLLMAAVGATVALALAACAPPEPDGYGVGDESVRLGYVEWASEIASTYTVAHILEEELGYEVELISLDVAPMYSGLARGDFDGIVAAWLPHTHGDYLEEYGDQFERLGANLEGAKIGWMVPQYVDINSIEELPDYAGEFGGEIIGIDPGAGLMRSSDEAMEVYGLEDTFTLVEGSDAAMTAALSRAIDNEEWIVVTGWTPHWKEVRWEMKYLDDPEGVFGEAEHIETIVREGLAEDYPALYEILDNFYWTPADMGEVMLLVEDGMSPEEAAARWVEENQDTVQEWLPEQ